MPGSGIDARLLPELALLGLLALRWGLSYLLIKVALGAILPVTLNAARVVIAATLLGAVIPAQRHRLPTGRAVWGGWRSSPS